MKFIAHLIVFLAALFAMYFVSTFIPYGIYINAAIVLYCIWKTTEV